MEASQKTIFRHLCRIILLASACRRMGARTIFLGVDLEGFARILVKDMGDKFLSVSSGNDWPPSIMS